MVGGHLEPAGMMDYFKLACDITRAYKERIMKDTDKACDCRIARYFNAIGVPDPVGSGPIVFCPLHAQAPAMLALLKEAEWASPVWTDEPVCPWCGAFKEFDPPGHRPDCPLSALLAAING